MAAGDWPAALRIASRFPRLGDHREDISRAWTAVQHPEFYREIGQSPDDLVARGIAALKARYPVGH
jgi:hypothetical protein